jgi:hypothetical protein
MKRNGLKKQRKLSDSMRRESLRRRNEGKESKEKIKEPYYSDML